MAYLGTKPTDAVLETDDITDGVVTSAKISDGTITSTDINYPLTTFSSTGIDDNATSTAITIDSSENIGIGTTSPVSLGSNITTVEITGGSTIRQGGIYLSNSDKSVKSYIYGSNTATNLGTETNIPLVLVTNNTERMRIDSSGNLLVGTTSTTGQGGFIFQPNLDDGAGRLIFDRASTTASSLVIDFENGDTRVGNISYDNSSTSYNTSSDYRLKENVVEIEDATTRLKQLKPKKFNFIINPNKTVDGFLAHEVSDIVPEAITGEKDAVDADGNPIYQGIDQSKLVPLLTAALQEEIAKREALEARVAALEAA